MHIPEVIKRHPKASLVVLNLFFAILAVVGQVGENVSLPLWSNAASSNCSIYRSATSSGNMDSYFILSFASFSYVVIFGVITLVMFVVRRKSITYDDLTFPQWQFMLIGLCDALNGILIVFAAPPNRTAPFLQAILGNIVIPLTIILRCESKYYSTKLIVHIIITIFSIQAIDLEEETDHSKNTCSWFCYCGPCSFSYSCYNRNGPRQQVGKPGLVRPAHS